MQLSRVKQIFKWAAAGELVTVTAYQRLDVVEIRHGRKTKAIPPVDDAMVEQTLPHLTPMIADMVRLQRFTGMRPGELVMMQPDEVDRSDEIWVYVPDRSCLTYETRAA